MKTQAIIPTAGTGARIKSRQPKPLIEINGKPIFIHTLEVFQSSTVIDSVILIVHEELVEEYKKAVNKHKINNVKKIVAGGDTRVESVSNGLKELDEDTDFVVIHDGVRPMVTKKLIEDSVSMCAEHQAIVTAVPVKPTIKRVNSDALIVEETLNRNDLWEVQTPQVFSKELIMKAHSNGVKKDATDDASMVEQLGVKVKVLKGDYHNLKVTTQEDLVITKAFLSERIG